MDAVAILPAAGAASRLRGAFKELLPVALRRTDDGVVPVPALVHALETCAASGVRDAVVVVSPGKLELARLLADGADVGVRVCWVVQPTPAGLTDAVLRALPWAGLQGGRRAAVVLPDTVFAPADALARTLQAGGDLALGVFPTDRPHELGPVALDGGRVVSVQEKPSGPCPRNTWGILAFGEVFACWLAARAAADPSAGARSLGIHAQGAVDGGLDVRGVLFDGGSYRDLGTPRGLAEWIVDARE